MKTRLVLLSGLAFGVVHFLLVGLPIIFDKANSCLYIFVVDLPLVIVTLRLMPIWVQGSKVYDFWMLAVGGTVMYVAIGCLFGAIVSALTRRSRPGPQPTRPT